MLTTHRVRASLRRLVRTDPGEEHMRKRSVVVIPFVSALVVAVAGGSVGTATAAPGPVRIGRHVRVAPNAHHDVSPPLRDLRPYRAISRAHPALRVPGAPQRVVHARD